ncbi:hypothetical protein ABEY43_07380 [Priestia megaterium]
MSSKLTVTTKGEEINFTGVVSKGDKQSFVVHNDGSVTIKADSIEFKDGSKGIVDGAVIADGFINFDKFTHVKASELLEDVNTYIYKDAHKNVRPISKLSTDGMTIEGGVVNITNPTKENDSNTYNFALHVANKSGVDPKLLAKMIMETIENGSKI